MTLEYSRGFTATVEHLSPDSPFSNIADLVRIEKSRDFKWFERLFLRHQIAHFLFPKNFIQVVAVSNTSSSPKPDFHTTFETKLYSKLAPVSPEHATFSAHYAEITKVAFDGYSNPEEAPKCQCQICLDHNQFHTEYKLKTRAKDLNWRYFNQYGIYTPFKDLTDYCQTPNGLIFFEIEMFTPANLRRLLINPRKSPKKGYLQWLVNKYEVSQNISRTKSPTGGVNFS